MLAHLSFAFFKQYFTLSFNQRLKMHPTQSLQKNLATSRNKRLRYLPKCIELSIHLSTFQEPFSDPKSDTIYLRKIVVQNHQKPAKIAISPKNLKFKLRICEGKLYPILDLKTVPERKRDVIESSMHFG